ncbi:GOLPH3/VPS74 family protein [Prolixibacter denitrificans]|uniref:Golgi phosphoprotein 3 GPP34 n=1 Tax=Prolixibacter denitrificans TaxID=1541063 RepID=A0A2P8C6K5_9BACT|nr:GPP34 family phosphoprotein [Prolixibacter denitrificans]PSK80602.1 Golgi phosphoprotein 3 GPP34 [Prolixibacter denitrificans]GET22103.1 hypothetical protein JCM18694_23490 [Prolixibacter denitrificans]
MELSIAEKFLLIAHHPRKARFLTSEPQLNFGLVGTFLLEMSINNQLHIENNRVFPDKSVVPENPTSREIYYLVKGSGKNRTIRLWLRKLSRKANRYRWEVLENLKEKRLMRIERRKFLGIIPYRKSYVTDSRTRDQLLKELKKQILSRHRDTATSNEDMAVLGLIEACKLHRTLTTDRTELKKLRKALKELIKESPIAGTVQQTIRQVQAAVIGAIVASPAAAGGSS